MKIYRFAIIGMLTGCIVCAQDSTKESFVIKRNRAPSLATLKEECAEKLGEIIERMPEIQEKLVKEQARITREMEKLLRIQKEAIHNLYDLLDGKKAPDKQELQKMADSATKTLAAFDKNYGSADDPFALSLSKRANGAENY